MKQDDLRGGEGCGQEVVGGKEASLVKELLLWPEYSLHVEFEASMSG